MRACKGGEMKGAALAVVAIGSLCGCTASDVSSGGKQWAIQYASNGIIMDKRFAEENMRANAAKFCTGGPWRPVKTEGSSDGMSMTIVFECLKN